MLTLLESHRVTMSQDIRQGLHQAAESCVWGSQSPPPPHPRPYTAGILHGGWILTVSGSLSPCTIFLSGKAFTFRRTLFSLGDLHYRGGGAGEASHWLPELPHFHSDIATWKKTLHLNLLTLPAPSLGAWRQQGNQAQLLGSRSPSQPAAFESSHLSAYLLFRLLYFW